MSLLYLAQLPYISSRDARRARRFRQNSAREPAERECPIIPDGIKGAIALYRDSLLPSSFT
jgi:hypothetical protein